MYYINFIIFYNNFNISSFLFIIALYPISIHLSISSISIKLVPFASISIAIFASFCALILAKNAGFDVFNCLNIMNNEEAFDDLLFGKGGGKLKYYFWNFVCPHTEPKDLSLVLM